MGCSVPVICDWVSITKPKEEHRNSVQGDDLTLRVMN